MFEINGNIFSDLHGVVHSHSHITVDAAVSCTLQIQVEDFFDDFF